MTLRQYNRAKSKFFRRRVESWTLYYNRKKALSYAYGVFIPFKQSNDTWRIMRMSDTDAFWYAHKLSVANRRYSLKYYKFNNSITFTTPI